MTYYKIFNSCQFCGDHKSELQESHLIPKFVIDWIKNTSKTNRIRTTSDPEKPLQDGLKPKMLCSKCENKFSNWENKFSTHIFKKIANYRNQAESYTVNEEHQLCILSIFWRLLHYNYYSPNTIEYLNKDKSQYKKLLMQLKKILILNKPDSTISIYYSAIERGKDYLGLGQRSVMTLERGFGDGSAIFLGSPHRYYSVLRLPFFVFYIFGGNWLKDSFRQVHLFKIGTHTLKSIQNVPDIIKNHLNNTLDNLQSQQLCLSENSITSIVSAFEKNTKITGTDKSLKMAKEFSNTTKQK